MKKNEIETLLDQLFRQARMQLGTDVKGRWMHDGGDCPGCGNEITVTRYKKQDAVSLNAFLYREHGVLIGYMLCGKCANKILKSPYRKLAVHDEIEKNLKQAFVKHLGH